MGRENESGKHSQVLRKIISKLSHSFFSYDVLWSPVVIHNFNKGTNFTGPVISETANLDAALN